MSTDRITSPFGDPFDDKGKDPVTDAAQTLPLELDTRRPSDFGLGVSDEQTDQVELVRPPGIAEFEGFPDAPTLHRLRQVSDLQLTDNSDPDRIATNTGRPIYFDGNLFTGCAMLWTKGVPSQPEHLFHGQRRKSSITVQGRFKRPVVMSHLVTGPETYSLQHLSLAFHNIACLQIASRISPQMKFGPPSRPFLQVPVMSLSQKVIVSEPGDEPQLAGRTEQGAELYKAILEDTGGENSWEFKKSPLNKEKVFDMGHIWTFHMHQHIVDLSTFNMQILKQFDITHYLNGQPLQSMIKDRATGEYVVSFEVWHEKLIKDAERYYEQKQEEFG
ncbi:MAG: hypothetical protein FRX49_05086 [Trebouxia sp. A1-2]|nr:MAG: hypothetical protein FRX49_05086 [Trebouxia sp. A1-2]